MKRLILLFSLLLFASISFSQKNEKVNPQLLEKKAEEFYRSSKYDSAAYYHLMAIKISEKKENWLDCVRLFGGLAWDYFDMVKTDTAIFYIRKAINVADEHLDTEKRTHVLEKAELYFILGKIHLRNGKYDSTIYYSQKALSMINWSDKDSKLKKAKLWGLTGDAYSYLGEYTKAEELCLKALEIEETILGKNNESLILSLYNLSSLYVRKGKYDKALEGFQRTVDIIVPIHGEFNIKVAAIYNQIGRIYGNMGKYDEALEEIIKAIDIYIKLFGEKAPQLSSCYNTIGSLYQMKTEYSKALEYYEKSLHLKILTSGENHPHVAEISNNIGSIYLYQKNYKKSLEYYKKSLKIYLLNYKQEHPKVALAYNNLALEYYAIGNFDKALEYSKKSLEIRNKIYGENHNRLAYSHNVMGLIYSSKKNYNDAIKHLNKALEIRINVFGGKHPLTSNSFNLIGNIHYKKGEYNKALKNIQNALIANLPSFDDTLIYHNPKDLNAFSNKFLLETLRDKAQTLYQLYMSSEQLTKDINASISTYDLFFKLTNQMRNNYSNESTKLVLSEETKGHTQNAIIAAIKYDSIHLSNKKKAFEYLEKSKSTTIGAHLNDQQIKCYSNITDSLLNKEKRITINRRELKTQLQQAKAKKEGYDTLQVQKLQDQLFYSSRQYDSLMTTFKNEYPDYYQLKYQQKVASIEELQEQLDEKTTLLNYFVADTTLFIAALTKDSLVYKVVKTDSSFHEQLIDYHLDIEFDFTKDELQASNKLYNYLIAPVEDLIKGKNKLVIIPDEKLYYVPFETLCKNGSDSKQPDYLIKNYAINYHHSATLWLNSKEKESKSIAQNSFIGFAPVFDPEVNNGTILSNEWLADTTDTELATRSVSSDFSNFNALPNSEKEIKSILKLFKKKYGKAEGYLHKEATEENFKNHVSDYKYVHIASHSFTNDKYPALSGIAFSQPDTTNRKENDEDGILYAGESYNLNLSNADLVVLSSCKSGLGKLVKGEGFLSLSRGFIYSGAPNIVYSLWSVKDEPTKNLMVHFYKQLLNGENYPEALRKAKLKIMSNSKTSQPKYWAAWVLLGK